jgi:hypothetical protein
MAQCSFKLNAVHLSCKIHNAETKLSRQAHKLTTEMLILMLTKEWQSTKYENKKKVNLTL